jgi:hypothetical protein
MTKNKIKKSTKKKQGKKEVSVDQTKIPESHEEQRS